MERLALIAIIFFSGLWAIHGAMATAPVAARKGYNPRLGAVVGALVGFSGTLLAGLLVRALWPDQGGAAVIAGLLAGWAALIALWRLAPDRDPQTGSLPLGDALKRNIVARHMRGTIARTLFLSAIGVALIALATLVATIANKTIGLTAVQYAVEPEALALTAYDPGAPLGELDAAQIPDLLVEHVRAVRLHDLVLERVLQAKPEKWETLKVEPLGTLLAEYDYPAKLAETPLRDLSALQSTDLLARNLSAADLQALVYTEAGRPLSLFSREELVAVLTESFSATELQTLILRRVMGQDTIDTIPAAPVWQVVQVVDYPAAIAEKPFGTLSAAESAQLLAANLDRATLDALVIDEAGMGLLRDALDLPAQNELAPNALAALLAQVVSVDRLHTLVSDEVLRADNPDLPQVTLETVLTAEQAAHILMDNLALEDFAQLVLDETDNTLLAQRSPEQLAAILAGAVPAADLRALALEMLVPTGPDAETAADTVTWQVLKGDSYPDELGPVAFDTLDGVQTADILLRNLERADVEDVLTLEADNRDLGDISERALGSILAVNVNKNLLRVTLLTDVVGATRDDFPALSGKPIGELFKGRNYHAALAETSFSDITAAQAADLLARNLSRSDLEALVFEHVVVEQVAKGWTLVESLTDRDAIEAYQQANFPRAELQWYSWVNLGFLDNSINYKQADATGVRPAIYGSLLIILITIMVAFPVGVGAAIYLEEYAGTSRINQVIQTNINNLAGVPSIIYGMLGLAIFVRSLDHITSGSAFGTDGQNGRTVISAGFTLALLILPVIIINAQEAIRAVPGSLRQASFGLGATKWQTIWHHVLPNAMPGILTGTILAISRAIGETAPLILVGGATFLSKDPDGPFSQFTALPLVIYRLTTLPQDEFRNAAAAAIVVLLALLLTLNSIAVILRNRFSRSLS